MCTSAYGMPSVLGERKEFLYERIRYNYALCYTVRARGVFSLSYLTGAQTESVPENLQRDRLTLGRQAGDAQHDRCETLMRISLEGDSTLHSDETRNGTKRRFFDFF